MCEIEGCVRAQSTDTESGCELDGVLVTRQYIGRRSSEIEGFAKNQAVQSQEGM